MKFRRPAQDPLEINLTPLIDCLLFLLIFFMLSTSFTKASRLHLTLPQAHGDATAPAPSQPLIVTVTREGRYAVNGVVVESSDEQALQTAIDKASGGKRDMDFVISADGASPHQTVVTVMDAAGRLGFVNLSISTRSSDEH
ncbi:MAG: biopolymer transporter ExbD [Pseudomonadales bacterium]|nr:biopolymer transporter ExbD [Pseudomonadales bacterium]